MMTGSEVPTTVDASIDTNMPSSSPESAISTARWVMPLWVSAGGAAGAAVFGFFDARTRWSMDNEAPVID